MPRVVALNPAAAGGRVGRHLDAIVRLLRRELGDFTLLPSEEPGDLPGRVQAAVEGGADTVLSLGGDGTHGAVVGGIMAAGPDLASRVRLGILPAGTGGDFRRMLVGSATLAQAARTLASATSSAIDVGSVELVDDDGRPSSRWFLNLASAGMSGLVDRLVNASGKRLGGKLTFVLATWRALRRYRPARVRVQVDGRTVGAWDIATVCVCNGRWAGGGMLFAPEARLADGLFDVIVIRHGPALASVLESRKLYNGGHVGTARVSVFRGAEVCLDTLGREPALLDVDGESPGRAPATFRVHPRALQLLAPRPELL